MNDNNTYSPIDFNKLAAYLDGNLPSDEMASLESLVSSDVRLSSMMDEISELDNQVIDNCYSEDVISDLQFLDVTLPEIESSSIQDDFLNAADSSDEFLSSLFTDNLSFHNGSALDFSNDDPDDLMDDNNFNDL